MFDKHPTEITFRAVGNSAELEALMRLRYETFIDSPVQAFVCPNGSGIDIDRFDINAHHVGLFRGDIGIGYARLITLTTGPQASLVSEVASRNAFNVGGDHDGTLPVLGYAPGLKDTHQWVLSHSNDGRGVIEAGRLALAAGDRSRRMGHFFGQALVAYWLASEFAAAVIACRPTHVRFWEQLGFRAAPGTNELTYRGCEGRILILTPELIPDSTRQVIEPMVSELLRFGAIRLAPTRPREQTGIIAEKDHDLRSGAVNTPSSTIAA
jgi:hypothetical protein